LGWLERFFLSQSIVDILLQMQTIGYTHDYGTWNLLLFICVFDQLVEAIKVLMSMGGAECTPDSNNYGIIISAMS